MNDEENSERCWETQVATMFGLGFLSPGPGTWGSLPGLALGMALAHWGNAFASLAILAALVPVAIHTIRKTEERWHSHDPGSIVIDEVLGQALAIAFLAPHWINALIGFVVFRFFDIAKPFPIKWLDENVPGPWGTLLDDLAAGLLTAILLYLSLS